MSDVPPLHVEDFAAFFEALHGRPPFPWQARLARQVASSGAWPEVLDLPTGAGKTAAIDVAVFHLALEAGRAARRAPLRVVYVVDRRTIVDQAHERALTIAEGLESSTDPVLRAVRARLASYGRDAVPLRIALLRGGIARSDLWARTPDQPLVAVSTVDQVGSRLLFRGYGVSDAMKPIHAGLLGNDVVYLLDEVHLSQPFRETLDAIGRRYRGWAERQLPSLFELVEMSATPGQARPDAFRLGQDDEQHPVLAKRLGATKLVTLCSATGRSFLGELEAQAKRLAAEPGATVAVVVNRVASARELHLRLSRSMADVDVQLLTGRMRPFDRDALEAGILPRIRAGRERDPGASPVVVVATQCIEAGADFDFDALVTECASLDALRQRFGRLDRLGEHVVGARGVVVARTDTLDDDPVYGTALGNTWRWLLEQARGSAHGSDAIDFGIRGLEVPADAAERELLAPRAHAPVLMPSHLDAWVQTSPRPLPDPDVALWLHGPERGAADVQVVWRADLSAELLREAAEEEGVAVEDEGAAQEQEAAAAFANAGKREKAAATALVLGAVHALPPASAEAMSIPIAAVRRWLDGQPEPEVFDVEGAREVDGGDRVRAPSAERRFAVAWRGDSSKIVGARQVMPGDTLVVPASYGGIAFGTWSPSATDPVRDVAELAVLAQRGRAALRCHPEVLPGLLGPAVGDLVPQSLEGEEVDDRAAVLDWLSNVGTEGLAPESRRLLDLLAGASKRTLHVERLPLGLDPTSGEYFLIRLRQRVRFDEGDVSTEDDRASFTGIEVPLSAHLRNVGSMAGGFAERVGLAPDVASDIRLAGQWHDVGKIDPRFQRLLYGGSEFKTLVQSEPLAKSAMGLGDWRARERAEELSRYPRGARHELMSVALMESAGHGIAGRAMDWELVLHLVASHHGRCRPLAPCVADPSPVEAEWELDGVAVRASSVHGLERLDSGVGERFWHLVRRYGWWGLAWLETLLRLGDHRQSEEEQRGGVP